MKLRPLGDKILVQKIEKEAKTAGGLVLPDMSTKAAPSEGIVLAVGVGSLDNKGNRKPIEVKEGDKILYSAHTGVNVKVDGEAYTIVTEKDILSLILE